MIIWERFSTPVLRSINEFSWKAYSIVLMRIKLGFLANFIALKYPVLISISKQIFGKHF